MKLKHGNSYKTRDGQDIVKVTLTHDGNNYKFRNVLFPYDMYLPTGHIIAEGIENDKDLLELV